MPKANKKSKAANKKKREESEKKTYHRRMIFIIGISATILSMVITSFGIFNTLENKSVDWRFDARGPLKPEAPVVIVAIDDESFTHMPERWVWPRNFYAQAIENLNKWGAKVILFDVVYSEPTARNPKEDQIFADAVKKSGNVILGMALLENRTKYGVTKRALYPIDNLRDSAYALGLVHHPFDNDSYIRKSVLIVPDEKTTYYNMSFEALGKYYGYKKKDIEILDRRGHGKIKWGKIESPNRIFINYCGPGGTFETVPFHRVFSGKGVKKGMFKNKIVLIGSTTDLLHDVFNTPFSHSGALMPGVEIHANVINTLYTGNDMTHMDRLNSFFLLLAIGLLTSFMIFSIKALRGLIVVGVEIIVYFIVARYLFDAHNYVVQLVNPLFTMGICYLSISTYKVAVEEKENRKIKGMFSKYVSKELVDEMLKGGELKLGGAKKEITVLFTDIRGFTAMSENMQPEEILDLLNEYLTAMTDIVMKNKGTLDKFIGDAVMALFGTPVYYKDHALRAVMTGLMMQAKLKELNEKWTAEGKRNLKIGVGINSGEVVAGNMGSLKRMEYTVIGDNVNLASRLESLNKQLETEFLISQSTYDYVKDHIEAKEYKDITVKGKKESFSVYEVLGLK